MNYSGNITDWHQYNSVQANINEVPSTDHNVTTNHLAFIPSVSPSSLTALNTEGYKKYQNETSFNSRHFPPMNNISNGSNNTDNFALPSMVQMQGYIGQYSPTINRNSVMDNVKGPIDIRNGSMNTFNDDFRYRNNHMALPGQNSHLNGSNININTTSASIGSRNNSVCAVSSMRQGPTSFIPCKALCCNPNTNMSYQQWDKFGTYQSNASYRENMRLPGYQTENRQYGEHNYRKDNYENKEMLGSIIPNADPRRNFPEYKYNKDSMIPRGCAPPSGMIQNYPIQNYNYATECQKYPYPVKEYPKANNMGLQDVAMFKHQEQSYIAQQKYNAKQGQYPTNNMLPKTVPSSAGVDMTSPAQNSYYATQFLRNMPTEFPRACQKGFDNPQQVTTMQSTPGTSSRYHSYQQKIAMQRFSMENHLRELTRIPGYQSHPKYKESLIRYREILKLQQSYGCQTTAQHPVRIATSVNTVPSINLQFDQNGVLINSSCLSDGLSKTQCALNSVVGSKHIDKQGKEHNLSSSELLNGDNLHSRQSINHLPKEHLSSSYPNNFQSQDQFLINKCGEQTEFKVQENTGDSLNSNNVDTIATQQKTSKDFADKPDLDVRQFLANWDASEDEDDSSSNLPDVVLSNSTPLVVVEYENIANTTKILHNMDVKENICSKKHEKVTEEYPESSNSPCHDAESLTNLSECKNKDTSKSENIIHCITNSSDEIPTIHIVDNLQINNILEVSNEQIIGTLENQGTIPFYEENISAEEELTACENKEENLTKEADRCKGRKSPVQRNNQKLNVLETTSKSDADGKTNLQKQHSFASEESHNTDDISLPDLPTTECTPISTTLNTPIHSDSEEPSGRESAISSNPIEIIQNSPMISFTHSPIKIGSFEHLDDTTISKENTLLQFNLEEVNQPSNNSVNAFENAIISNNLNKSDNTCKSDISKSQINSNKNATIILAKKVENKALNVKAPDICVISAREYESEIISVENSKNANILKCNTDKVPSATHSSSKHVSYKVPIPIETSKCVLKNKLNENKQQQTVSVDTTDNADKHSDVNTESKKCFLIKKLQQNICNDKNAVTSTSRGNEDEAHTLIRYVDKSTLPDIQNVLSIPNINIYTSNTDESRNVNTVSIPKRCMDMLMSNKLSSNNSQSVCIIKENDRENFSKDLQNKLKNQQLIKNSNVHSSSAEHCDSSNVEILSDCVIFHKTCSTSGSKNNTELECDITHGKENNNEFISSNQENTVSVAITKKMHNQLHKSNEVRKVNTNVDSKSTFEEENGQNKIIEERKLELSRKECNIDNINVINSIQKQDPVRCITPRNNLASVDNCIENNRSIESSDFNIKCTSRTELQQFAFDMRDSNVLEKNTNSKNKKYLSEISPVTDICSINSEKSKSEKQYSVSKSFANKNANSDFEIQVTNVNLKFTDNDICKEIVTLRDKRQENMNNCPDGIKIEINVLCAERNIKEKLLQKDLMNVDSEMQEQQNNTACESKGNSLPHAKLNMEKESNKADEVINHEHNESKGIIRNKTVKDIMEVQEEPLSLIVHNKALPVGKENSLLQEFSNKNEVSKSILNKSQNDEKVTNSYTEVVREANSTNIFNEMEKQYTPSTSIDKSIDDLEDGNVCCIKSSTPFNITKNEPSNVVYSSASVSSFNINYKQNNANTSSFAEQISKFSNIQKSKIKEPFSVSYNYKDKKDDEDDSSSDKTDGTPNIVTIHVKTDNMNNEKFTDLDFTNFDLFSNESNKSNDNETGKWRRPITPIINQTLEECDLYGSTGGYVNPIFTSIEESNNRREIPVYRTKDGKITYSPNPKALFLENRERTHCTVQGHSSYKYFNHSKTYTFFKKDKGINNYKEKTSLEPNDTKITWSEATVKSFPEFLNENDNSQKHSYYMKTQGPLNLKHYHPKVEKQYNNINDNEIQKEYNKYSSFKYGEQKQHNNEDNHITYKDYLKSGVVTEESETCQENLKDILDVNMCLEEKDIKRTEMVKVSKAYTACHNTRNNNYIDKSRHNDASSSLVPKNTFLEKINLNETCDIKSKYCDTIKESIVPYAICDQTGNECSLNQSNNLTCETSNTIKELDKKEFKPNLNQPKVTELRLEENHFKDIGCSINDMIKHDSSSEVSKYFTEQKSNLDITLIDTDNMYVDTKRSELQTTSEISKYKKHHEINFSLKCEVDSDEKAESFEEDFDNTRDILKYSNKENILISKKDVLLTETLDVECSDSLKQLKNTKQKEAISYNSDESNSNIVTTNFSLESEVSKGNEDENSNQQITEANVFYADSNTSISEKEWKRLPSNCFKHDIQVMESDVISSNNLESEVHVIEGESMHISQIKESEISKTIIETVIEESSFFETSNSICKNRNFTTTDEHETSFSVVESKSQITHMNQDKDEVILSESTICNKNINADAKINTNEEEENENVGITNCLLNSMNNSKTKSFPNSLNFLVDNEVNTTRQLSVKPDVEIIDGSQDALKIRNSKEKILQEKQFNDDSCCSEKRIDIDSLYSSQKNYNIEVYNDMELEKINKMEEECSLSPPDITNTAYIDIDYSSISDCNTDDKPDLISKPITEENETNAKSKPELSPQPKIPKMIIRNTGSRSGTPVAEEALETSLGFPSFMHNKTKQSTFIIENEENNKMRNDSDSEVSSQTYNLYESKVPKMKIKFNDRSAKKHLEDQNTEISFKRKDMRKTIPKVKIKKIKTEPATTPNEQTQSSLVVMEVKTLDVPGETRKREKIPKLKLRKNQDITLSSETIRKRPNLKAIDIMVKKYKTDTSEIRSSQKYSDNITDNSAMSGHEIKNKSLSCISEKIPKVIIKRTSASAEFKCEFSEDDSNTVINSAKWQPEVKLQRSQLLDNMVKDLKCCRISKAYIAKKCIDIISSRRTHKLVKGYRFRGKKHSKSNKFYRSSSVSDLRPVKYEKNETLDYSCSNSKLCETDSSSVLKGIREHDEFSTKSLNRYKLDKNSHNLSERCPEESYVSDGFTDESLCKYSRAIHINTDNIDLMTEKSDTTNIQNNTGFKTSTANDLNIITSSTNSTSNASANSLQTQKDLEHDIDNENKFPMENNESESKLLKSDASIDDSIDNDSSVIKLDSSDESQSTIEILPASPDINQIQMEKHNINLNNEEGEQLYSEDAIPTQFELELEVTDSNIDSVDVPLLRHELNSENMNDSKLGTWKLDKKIQDFEYSQSYSQNFTVSPTDSDQQMLNYKVPIEDKISDKHNSSLSMTTLTYDNVYKNRAMETLTSRENVCCNDLLMKEVLAAKEMLKKCLSMSKSDATMRSKSKLEKPVDKNQNSYFTSSKQTKVSLKTAISHHSCETLVVNQPKLVNEFNQQDLVNQFNLEKFKRKDYDERVKRVIKSSKCPEREHSEQHTVVNVQKTLISGHNSPIISLKTLKRFHQSVPNKHMSANIECSKASEDRNVNIFNQDDHIHQLENKLISEVISDNEDLRIEDNKSCNESRRKEDNMPILEPEVSFNHDTNSDRDSSRSPPVITNQEVVTTQNEVLKCLLEEVSISKDEKGDSKKHIEKEYDMTVSDIVTQLAYHKKSTIRHKRYCTLCEKWFPTTSRHRRHLAGYQHRHLELTQRRTIHALFILFTGKPCSKLLRTTTMRDDCSIGELTPLQIAVEDLAKCIDNTETNLLIEKNDKK